MNVLAETRRATWSLAQIFVVVAVGTGIALLMGSQSILLSVGAILALAFLVLFLQRPDYGLLVVLLVRASTDVSFRLFGEVTRESVRLGGMPNIVLMSVVVLAGGLFILTRGLPLISLPGGRLLALFLLGGAVGVLRSDSTLRAVNEWLPVLASFVAYALAASLFRTPRMIQKALNVIAASFILPAVFGAYQMIRGQGVLVSDFAQPRILGTFVHPNPFGFFLVIVLALFLVRFMTHGVKHKAILLIGIGTAAVLLVGTFARVAWAGAMIVVFVIAALRRPILLLVLPLLVVFAIVFLPAIGERVADPLGGSFADRFTNLWPGVIREWRSATSDESVYLAALNRITGLGPGMGLVLGQRGYGASTPAHNDYLRILVEYGIFGLVNFVLLIGVLVIFAFRTWQTARNGDPLVAVPSLTFLSLTLAFPIMSLTDNVFGYTVNQVYFWSLAGLTVAASHSAYRPPLELPDGPLETGRGLIEEHSIGRMP
jgi:putative inorganic carbon (HCO3(-)) transporter